MTTEAEALSTNVPIANVQPPDHSQGAPAPTSRCRPAPHRSSTDEVLAPFISRSTTRLRRKTPFVPMQSRQRATIEANNLFTSDHLAADFLNLGSIGVSGDRVVSGRPGIGQS